LGLEFSTKKNKEGGLESYLKWTEKKKCDDFDVTVNGKLHHNGNTEADVEVEHKKHGVSLLLKGTLLGGPDSQALGATDDLESKNSRDAVGFEAKYSHKYFKGTVAGDLKRKNAKKITVSGSTEYDGFLAGASAQIQPETSFKPTTYSWGLGYAKDDFTVLLQSDKSNQEFKLAVKQDISKDLSGGVEFKHDLPKKTSNFASGLSYRIDGDQVLKLKMNDEQVVNVGYNVNLNKDLKAQLNLETSLKSLQGNESKSKVSLGFIYETK
jgi:hypothetical protein